MSSGGRVQPPAGAIGRPAPVWAFELALLAPSLAAGIGLTRLTNAAGAARVVAPVVVAVVLGQFVAAVGRRLGAVASLVLGGLAVALVTVWWFEPSTVWWGLPTSRTLHAAGHALSQAVTVTRDSPTPVAALSPVVMCVSAGAGLASVVGRAVLPWPALVARRRALLWALAPSGGLFSYAALLSSGADRVQAASAYVGGLVVVALAADRLGPARGPSGGAIGIGGPPSANAALGATASAPLTVVVAVGAVLVAGPSLGATLPHAFLSATARTGPGAVGGPVSPVADAVALVDDVGSLLAAGHSHVFFTAHSDEPTYWQVAALTDFDGRSWRPPSSTWTAINSLEPVGVLPAPATPEPTSTFTGEVRVAGLRSTLLPVPPQTLVLDGAGDVFDPPVGAIRAGGTVTGTTYSFVAGSPSISPPAAGGGGGLAGRDLEPYLRLPREPAAVVALARRIVAGARTPFGEAEALARFFDSGRFHYSLTARQNGGDPLESFLFHTHTGFCQQFAGAYAVLARIDGLPTQVAVGFDAGAGQGKDSYVVTAADAHVWPEVYLGPSTGWVSFEPTPPTGTSTAIAAGVVYGSAGAPGGGPAGGPGSPVTTNPKERTGGGSTATSSAASAPSGRSGAGAAGRSSARGIGTPPWWVLALLALVVVAALAAIRRRLADVAAAVRTRALAPGPAVAVHWRRAARAFEHQAGARGRSETMAEHAARMTARFPDAGEPYAALAHLASRACYSDEAVGATDVDRARTLGAQTRGALRHRGRRAANRPGRGTAGPRWTGRHGDHAGSARG